MILLGILGILLVGWLAFQINLDHRHRRRAARRRALVARAAQGNPTLAQHLRHIGPLPPYRPTDPVQELCLPPKKHLT